MPIATLVVPAVSEQARTARLVAGIAAHRAGVREESLDDVRLAVAEAVALAVHRARLLGEQPRPEVEIAMADDGRRFTVTVSDRIPVTAADDELHRLSLPLIRALADDSWLQHDDGGSQVGLAWPTAPAKG